MELQKLIAKTGKNWMMEPLKNPIYHGCYTAENRVKVISFTFQTSSELDFVHLVSRKGSKIRTVMLNEF